MKKHIISRIFRLLPAFIEQLDFKMTLLLLLLMCNCILTLRSQEYEHLIMYGQSLSTAHQSWPPLSTENVAGNYMIGNQVWINYENTGFTKLNPLIANIATATATRIKDRASLILAENPIVGAVNHIQLKTKGQYKFIGTSCGSGGLSIEQLSKEYYSPTYYKNFSNAISYASSLSTSVHCPVIIWMQGEYNYTTPEGCTGLTAGSAPTTDKNTYKSFLQRLKNNMQNDIIAKYKQTDKPLFITYQVGGQYSRGKEITIAMAQLEASNENDDIVCAGPIYPMTDRGGHLDSNGYRWYGEMLGKVYYRTKILGEDFKPLQPIEISRTDDPKVMKIKFYVPKPPLVLDELLTKKITDYGFEVYDNDIKKTIQSVTIVDDCVRITTTTDLVGPVEVIYAGTNNRGDGNLRDSDDEQAFYNYIDLDKKNYDGTYVYERDATETTLRPSSEPRDAAGVIYDKPYPLYNFSVAFYYKLEKDSFSYKVPNVYSQQTGLTYSIDNSNLFY
ncbi:MAG: hypothetical protein PHG64_05535 [Paludibacter sp.]|nr:hypothetical protein [Paludibacter sp.]